MSVAIGIMGGTFDPPHLGHVAAATAAWRQLGLDEVRVIPAGRAPLRSAEPVASAEQRVAMTRKAFAECPWAVVDEREVRRQGMSWSVETARELAREFPAARLVWILGADQLARLDRWKEAAELCSLVEFAVLARDEVPLEPPAALRDRIRLIRLEAPRVPVSSTALREALRRGDQPRNGLPSAVARHIDEHALYQD